MLEIVCTIVAILAVLGIWVILYDTHHFVVRKYSFSSGKIKKNLRMVMMSDLHNYRYGRENKALFDAIEQAEPDIIVIAGDMITAKTKEKFDKTLDMLTKLNEKYPVYYAYGNHEQKISLYTDRYGDMGERFDAALKETNVRILRNARVELPDTGVVINGLELEHAYFQRFHTKPMADDYLQKLMGTPDEEKYQVLLAHNPEYFKEYAAWGADLTLSGHIHGGIVRLPFFGGVISPAIRFFPKYDGGLFEEYGATMVLGRGLGTHSPKVRMFNPAELLVIDLTSA